MAFLLYSVADDSIPPIEYLPAEAGTYQVGECLAVDTSGSHQLDTSALPTHICMEAVTIATAGDLLGCMRITKDMIFEAAKDSTNTMHVGSTYDVASDGLRVDDNGTTNNNLECVFVEGAGSGDMVRVRFIK